MARKPRKLTVVKSSKQDATQEAIDELARCAARARELRALPSDELFLLYAVSCSAVIKLWAELRNAYDAGYRPFNGAPREHLFSEIAERDVIALTLGLSADDQVAQRIRKRLL